MPEIENSHDTHEAAMWEKINRLAAELTLVSRERDEAQKELTQTKVDLGMSRTERRRLTREHETMRDALAWYADERNWKPQPTPDADRGFYPTYVPAGEDKGKRAHAALAGIRAATPEDA